MILPYRKVNSHNSPGITRLHKLALNNVSSFNNLSVNVLHHFKNLLGEIYVKYQ